MRSRRLKIFFLSNICIFILTSAFLFTAWYNHKQPRNSSNNNKCNHKCNSTSLEQVADINIKPGDLPKIIDVAKSLKNENLFETGGNFHQYFDKSKEMHFDRPLSMYDPNDQEILKSLFPLHINNTEKVSTQTGRIQKQLRVKLKYAEPKLIYVTFFDNHLTPHSVQSNQCEVDNCRITTDKKEMKNADAVIFHQIVKHIERPKNRPHQIWIFHQLESSKNIRFVSKHHELINWTATFRSDSVLQTPYGKYVAHDNLSKLPPQEKSKNYAQGKTKLAAWFVSNCGGYNGRMAYVNELQKYARIDVYGFCGPLSCTKGNEAYKCTDMLRENYKFYLAFENSNCRDYITEKFFHNALQHDVIPIVMGAHPDDYKKVAPPNSFIHVDEFNSPRQLAEYMHILDNNDDLYNEYFRWKGTGEFINTKFVCRLCAMLQISSVFPMWYEDVREWWTGPEQCVRPGRFKWSTWKKEYR